MNYWRQRRFDKEVRRNFLYKVKLRMVEEGIEFSSIDDNAAKWFWLNENWSLSARVNLLVDCGCFGDRKWLHVSYTDIATIVNTSNGKRYTVDAEGVVEEDVP